MESAVDSNPTRGKVETIDGLSIKAIETELESSFRQVQLRLEMIGIAPLAHCNQHDSGPIN